MLSHSRKLSVILYSGKHHQFPSWFILVHFFVVSIFTEEGLGLSAKTLENLHPAKISRYTVVHVRY